MPPLAGRIALVTGASRGIGYATALALAQAGAHVVAVARTVGGLEELDDAVRAAGSAATLVPLDLQGLRRPRSARRRAHERYGRLDVLVGNAAILGALSPLDHVEPKAWDEAFAVNVTANWRLIRAMDRCCKSSDAGRAVFVTSGAATAPAPIGAPMRCPRRRSKHWRGPMRRRPSSTKVRVNLFDPGPIAHAHAREVMPGEDPMTLPTPAEVAERIVDLCLPGLCRDR